MSTDDLEQRLQRQPLRATPEAWRQQILDAARVNSGTRVQDASSALRPNILRKWLWPHPFAWGGLAACWAAIFILHYATAPSAAEIAKARTEARFAAAYSALLRDPAAMAITTEPKADPFPVRPERRSPDLGCRSPSTTSARV